MHLSIRTLYKISKALKCRLSARFCLLFDALSIIMEQRRQKRMEFEGEDKSFLDYITKHLNAGSESKSLLDFITKRLEDTNEEIKNAVRGYYAARYGIHFVHKQILQLFKNYRTQLATKCNVTDDVDRIVRCSLMVTGPTNAGKSTFLNELLELSEDERYLTPESSFSCTSKIVLIQDDDALLRLSGNFTEPTSEEGSISVIESEVNEKTEEKTPIFREIVRIHYDSYDSLAKDSSHLIERFPDEDEERCKPLSENCKRKDTVIRISNYRNLLSTGLQVVDFPGNGNNVDYVKDFTGFVKPTVCLWLSDGKVFRVPHDKEHLITLREYYKRRFQTRFIVAIGAIDEIEDKKYNYIDSYITCVKKIASGMDVATIGQTDCGHLFDNRLQYDAVTESENTCLDILGISAFALVDVKTEKQKLDTEECKKSWFLVQNWLSLKRDIATAIQQHTKEYVKKKQEYLQQALNALISDLRCTLKELNDAQHSMEQSVRSLQNYINIAASCQTSLEDNVYETIKIWDPMWSEIIKEWSVEEEAVDIDGMNYYQHNPRRRVLTSVIDSSVSDKIKCLVILTTDHAIMYLTTNLFNNLKRHVFHEEYSQNVSKLYVRLLSIGYSAIELPKSMDSALKELAEFYEVQCLIEEMLYSSFDRFHQERKAFIDTFEGSSETQKMVNFIHEYMEFLFEKCLPDIKQKLRESFHRKITSIFQSTKNLLKSRIERIQKKKEIRQEKAKFLQQLIDCKLLSYCCFLSMYLASLGWEFCDECVAKASERSIRISGRHLMNHSRNLVEVKMLLEGLAVENKKMMDYFVLLYSWRFNRNDRTIVVEKDKTVRSLMQVFTLKSFDIRKRYKFGLHVLLGMKAIHELGYVVNDFSPENIFLSENESRAMIDLNRMRTSPYQSLTLTENDIIPPIHLHPDRFNSTTNPSKIYDLFSYATILWFIMDGTGTKQNLPATYLKAQTCGEIHKALSGSHLSKPDECDGDLYQQMKNCWNLTNKGRTAIEKVDSLTDNIEKQLRILSVA